MGLRVASLLSSNFNKPIYVSKKLSLSSSWVNVRFHETRCSSLWIRGIITDKHLLMSQRNRLPNIFILNWKRKFYENISLDKWFSLSSSALPSLPPNKLTQRENFAFWKLMVILDSIKQFVTDRHIMRSELSRNEKEPLWKAGSINKHK